MKQTRRFVTRLWALVIIALVQLSFCGVIVYAQSSNDDAGGLPFQIEITPVPLSKKTIVLGEPIVLRYRIKNIAPYSVTMNLNLNPYERSWYAVEFQNTDGTKVSNIVPPPKRVEGYTNIYATWLMPGQQCEGFIVAGRRGSGIKQGKGIIHLSVTLRYEPVSSREEFSEKFALLSEVGPLWRKRFDLPLEILPADTLALRREARKVTELSLKQEGNERKALLTGLFLFPEEAALSSWTLLAATPNIGYEIVPFLADLPSRRVADLLESIGWPPNDREIIAAQSALLLMQSKTKDENLKTYVSKILARHNRKTNE